MSIIKPDLTRVWAAGAPVGNVEDPDVTSPGKFDAGWQAEVPTFENFNFLQQLFTQGLAYNNEQGINTWDNITTYPIFGLAKGSNGKLYTSIIEQVGNNPTTDLGINWKRSIATFNDIVLNQKERLHEGTNGAIVFIFDDGKREVIDNGVPAFVAQGEVANMALISSRFLKNEPWATTVGSQADWLAVQALGWEAISHGYNETTVFNSSLDLAVGNAELKQQFDTLNRLGFNATQFVAPSSVLDSKFLPQVQKYFSAAHIGSNTADPAVATPDNGNDAYLIRRVSLEENLTSEALFNTFVDYCKANNTLGVVYAHEVDGSFGTVPLTSTRLNAHIDYCQAAAVPILTVSDALQRFNTNTIRGNYLDGEKAINLESFKIQDSNLLANSSFHIPAFSGWTFAAGTVGATNRIDVGNMNSQHVFIIGAGAGSGTTQLSQIVKIPTSRTPLPIFASVVCGAVSGTLDDQDLIITLNYRKAAATVGTKNITYNLTNVLTKYELKDFIMAQTQADELEIIYKIANNTPGTAVEIGLSMPSLGFTNDQWDAKENKTYVRSLRTTTQTGVTGAGAIVAFATTAADYLNEYDDAGTFTASRSGLLKIDSSVMINDLGFGYDMTKLLLDIRKNGTAVLRGSTKIDVASAVAGGASVAGDRFGEPEVAVSATIDVVAGDTITIFLSHNGTTTMIIDPNDNATWLTIVEV